MAARHAAKYLTALLVLCLISVPMIGQAKPTVGPGYEKSKLVTIEDFIQHAESEGCDIHDLYFELRPYEGTQTCLMCHEGEGDEMLQAGHFKWSGPATNIVGLENQQHGKKDLINNFCIATDTNEPRCSQCHAGYGYTDKNFDFTNAENVD